MPADLARAISHAHTICGWQENLRMEELPPEWMWSVDDELTRWFEEVMAHRANPASTMDETPDLEQNEYAKGRR